LSLFISFEGGEGSGKSTQAEVLAQRLQRDGIRSVVVREPGTTPLGWYLRDWLKRQDRKDGAISHGAELFLFAAARAEFVEKVLRPALDRRGRIVIADRYADSTTAYQGYGRRVPLDDVAIVNRLATQGLMPDLTFLLDCPPAEALGRVGSVQTALALEPTDASPAGRMDQEGTRFEEESLEFHRRVRAGYLKLAGQEPDRWCVIDATRTVAEIGGIVWERVRSAMADAAGPDAPESVRNLPLWAGGGETPPDPKSQAG
jgi:dTMP kinase